MNSAQSAGTAGHLSTRVPQRWRTAGDECPAGRGLPDSLLWSSPCVLPTLPQSLRTIRLNRTKASTKPYRSQALRQGRSHERLLTKERSSAAPGPSGIHPQPFAISVEPVWIGVRRGPLDFAVESVCPPVEGSSQRRLHVREPIRPPPRRPWPTPSQRAHTPLGPSSPEQRKRRSFVSRAWRVGTGYGARTAVAHGRDPTQPSFVSRRRRTGRGRRRLCLSDLDQQTSAESSVEFPFATP